jgi:hypothetical protein
MYNEVFSRTFSGAEYYSGKINQSLVMCKFNTNKSCFSVENQYLRAFGTFLAFPVVFGRGPDDFGSRPEGFDLVFLGKFKMKAKWRVVILEDKTLEYGIERTC